MKVKATQSSVTLFDSMGCILHARIPEWAAVPFSRASSPPRDQIQVPRNAGRFFSPTEPQGNMPRNEEMLTFPLLFSQGKATRNMLVYFVMYFITYLLIFFAF